LIVALPSSPAALAAKAATTSIPIAFALGVDPVEIGLVQSYNAPGGNGAAHAVTRANEVIE
jgi:putative ABC transport system substrate-binding protein